MSANEVLQFAKKIDAKQLDLRFTDIPSLQHHVSYPINELDEGSFEDGFGMDGSSIRGWAAIHEQARRPLCLTNANICYRFSAFLGPQSPLRLMHDPLNPIYGVTDIGRMGPFSDCAAAGGTVILPDDAALVKINGPPYWTTPP